MEAREEPALCLKGRPTHTAKQECPKIVFKHFDIYKNRGSHHRNSQTVLSSPVLTSRLTIIAAVVVTKEALSQCLLNE